MVYISRFTLQLTFTDSLTGWATRFPYSGGKTLVTQRIYPASLSNLQLHTPHLLSLRRSHSSCFFPQLLANHEHTTSNLQQLRWPHYQLLKANKVSAPSHAQHGTSCPQAAIGTPPSATSAPSPTSRTNSASTSPLRAGPACKRSRPAHPRCPIYATCAS
jgi:hypothetical protein